MKGFTLIETIIATGIISLVSVASVYILFLSLNLRDLTLATTKTEESLRIFDRSLKQATIGAQTISGGGSSLFLRSTDLCWSFVYDSTLKNVRYTKISQAGCVPDQAPVNLFFPAATKINSLDFALSTLSTGGRQVNVSGVMQTVLPFDVYQTSFSSSYINLID